MRVCVCVCVCAYVRMYVCKCDCVAVLMCRVCDVCDVCIQRVYMTCVYAVNVWLRYRQTGQLELVRACVIEHMASGGSIMYRRADGKRFQPR